MAESVEAIPQFAPAPMPQAPVYAGQPTVRQWALHISLFLLTAVTTTIAGVFLSSPQLDVPEPPFSGLVDYLFYVPAYYFRLVVVQLAFAFSNPEIITQGLLFSSTLLAILTSHEMGHYIACRKYGVNATLPFFIPAPPLFIAGTFGAFIKIKSPIPSRRALLDIGLAGPIAGFVMTLPFAVIGILQMQPGVEPVGTSIIFNDPPLFRLIAFLTGVPLDPYAQVNPFYMSAWIGLLVTSLNLIPVGQLDGGHGTYALFGAKAHQKIGLMAFLLVASLSVMGMVWHGSPSGFLYSVLLAIMLRVRHPQTQWTEPLGTVRMVIAIISLIVFALSFWPFPITIT